MTALVVGGLFFVVAGGLITGGATLAVADNTMRDGHGYIVSGETAFSTEGFAIVSKAVQVHADAPASFVPERLLGDAKVEVTSDTDTAIFAGVADAAEAEAYLSGVARSTVTDFRGGPWTNGTPVYRHETGGGPPTAPTEADIWTAAASGPGRQTVTWPLESGDWTIVVMNADGTPGVAADVAVGATLPGVGWLIAVLLSVGGTLMLLSLALIIGALRAGAKTLP